MTVMKLHPCDASIESIYFKHTCTAALEAHGWTAGATHPNFIDSNDPELIIGERCEMQNDRVEAPWVQGQVFPFPRQPVIIIILH